MRWQGQALGVDDGTLPEPARAGLMRSVRMPEFVGVTFHEVLCTSALERVPEGSALPFRFGVTTFRDCPGDAAGQLVVAANVAAVLQRELARRSWNREHVVLGADTDPYQRAEGHYRLMPAIIGALTESRTPFTILTKSALLQRDLPLLRQAAETVPVGIGASPSTVRAATAC